MTFACTDCSRCGKCYDKNSTCAACGHAIYLLDNACSYCGEPITEKMRAQAKQAYLDKKKTEHDKIVELAQKAKKNREKNQRPRPVYPWE